MRLPRTDRYAVIHAVIPTGAAAFAGRAEPAFAMLEVAQSRFLHFGRNDGRRSVYFASSFSRSLAMRSGGVVGA